MPRTRTAKQARPRGGSLENWQPTCSMLHLGERSKTVDGRLAHRHTFRQGRPLQTQTTDSPNHAAPLVTVARKYCKERICKHDHPFDPKDSAPEPDSAPPATAPAFQGRQGLHPRPPLLVLLPKLLRRPPHASLTVAPQVCRCTCLSSCRAPVQGGTDGLCLIQNGPQTYRMVFSATPRPFSPSCQHLEQSIRTVR